MTFANITLNGLLIGGVYALIAVGVTFIFGVVRVVNFAHGEFVMYGAYGAYFLHAFAGVDLILAIAIIAPVSFLFGLVVQRLIVQPLLDQHLMQIFATFGLLLLMQSAILALTTGSAKTLRTSYSNASVQLGQLSVNVPRLVVFLVAITLTFALLAFLKRTTVGTAIRAISQDKQAARLMGINVEVLYMVTMGTGTILAAIAGALLAPAFTLTPEFGFTFVLPAFVAAVLGGMGSIEGALVGGLVVGLLEGYVSFYFDASLAQAATFLVLVIVLVIRPWGLLGSKGMAEQLGTM
jgi:branched-chain amino acid transport system permease protein